MVQRPTDPPVRSQERDHHVEAGLGDGLEEGAAAVVHPDVALVDPVQREVRHRPEDRHAHHDGRRVRLRHPGGSCRSADAGYELPEIG